MSAPPAGSCQGDGVIASNCPKTPPNTPESVCRNQAAPSAFHLRPDQESAHAADEGMGVEERRRRGNAEGEGKGVPTHAAAPSPPYTYWVWQRPSLAASTRREPTAPKARPPAPSQRSSATRSWPAPGQVRRGRRCRPQRLRSPDVCRQGHKPLATRSAHHNAGPRRLIVAHPPSSHAPGLLVCTAGEADHPPTDPLAAAGQRRSRVRATGAR